MSYHVYIARAGWGETPITLEEWTRAVSDLPELETRRAQRGDGLIVHLKGVRRQWLRLTQGCVLSQAPEEDLVSIMFHLATRLDARVYSERAKPYESLADWRRRTKRYRARQAVARSEARSASRARRIRWFALLITSALLGVALGYLRR